MPQQVLLLFSLFLLALAVSFLPLLHFAICTVEFLCQTIKISIKSEVSYSYCYNCFSCLRNIFSNKYSLIFFALYKNKNQAHTNKDTAADSFKSKASLCNFSKFFENVAFLALSPCTCNFNYFSK